jgi:hypothetical protein
MAISPLSLIEKPIIKGGLLALSFSCLVVLVWPDRTWTTTQELWIPSSQALENPRATTGKNKGQAGEELLWAVRSATKRGAINVASDRRFKSEIVYVDAQSPEDLTKLEELTKKVLLEKQQKTVEKANQLNKTNPGSTDEARGMRAGTLDTIRLAEPSLFTRTLRVETKKTNTPLRVTLALLPWTLLIGVWWRQWDNPFKYRIACTTLLLGCITCVASNSYVPPKKYVFYVKNNRAHHTADVNYGEMFSHGMLKSNTGEVMNVILTNQGNTFHFSIPDLFSSAGKNTTSAGDLLYKLPMETDATWGQVSQAYKVSQEAIREATIKKMVTEKRSLEVFLSSLPPSKSPFDKERRTFLENAIKSKKELPTYNP